MAQAQLRDAQRHHVREADGRRGAGVEIGRQRHRDARLDEPPRRCLLALAEKRHRRREEDRDGAALRERADAGFRHAGQMVGAHSAELGGESGAARLFQLIGVQLETQPAAPRGRQDRSRFRDGEHAGLAEHIAEPRQTFAGDGRDHPFAQQPYVRLAVGAVLRGHLVGAEERGDERGGRLRREALHHAQLLALGFEFEPVSRLDLDRRRAVREQRGEPRAGDRDEVVLGPSAHVAHRFQNPAAGRGDRLIALAEGAALLVVEPRGAEHRMGVAIYETRVQDAVHLDFIAGGVRLAQLPMGADGGDAVTVDQHRRVFQDLELRQLAAPARARRAAAGDDRARTGEEGSQSLASCIGRRTPVRRAVSSASG